MESTQRRWIVLFERTFHGPYTETEVKRLVAEGIINLNTLSYLDQGETKAPPVWRFLWQWPEFDRRRGKTPTKAQLEKRKPVSEEEIQLRIKQRLEKELPEPEKPAPPPPPPEAEPKPKPKPRAKPEEPFNPFAEFRKPSAADRSLKRWKAVSFLLFAALGVAVSYAMKKPPVCPPCLGTAGGPPRTLERTPGRALGP